ncbi:hypothetical protein [Methylobacterium radiodurans]|uniref:Uncharacterized protein n=1 Tax=Methylobacterium radiodurans TaxID=2202828 RepID=A0A2U8VV21_9HYPH|nr:hypothetical protein [Methylobacterium radiodurans]AWN37555.1 hypothetical protein DK427_18980 [Methylobacterium radiodurans]
MLDEAFKHVRYAVALRDCAQRSRIAAERELLMSLASVHERRGRALIGAVEARRRAPAGTRRLAR